MATDSVNNIEPFPNACSASVTFTNDIIIRDCPTPLVDWVNNPDPIPTGNYGTVDSLYSDGLVVSGNTVNLRSGRVIQLGKGFHAESGSTFSAVIANCPGLNAIAESEENVTENPIAFESLPKNIQNLEMRVVPNPFKEQASIEYFLNSPNPISFNLFDGQGRMIKKWADKRPAKGWNQYTLNARNFEAGMYYLVLKTNRKTITRKLVLTP